MYRQNYPDAPGMHDMRTRYRYLNGTNMLLQTVKKHLVNLIISFMLFNIGIALGFWNESRYMDKMNTLEEGLTQIKIIETSSTIFDENHHKLIHISGPLRTAQPIMDNDFDIVISVVKLRRNVLIYQWVEYEQRNENSDIDDLGFADISYSYDKEWKQNLINHNSFYKRFGHENPLVVKVKEELFTSENVMCGNYHLSSELIKKISNFKKIPIYKTFKENYSVHNGEIFYGNNPENPQVGDLRIFYEVAGISSMDIKYELFEIDKVSVIGMQDKNKIVAFQTLFGAKIQLLTIGEYSAKDMFKNEKIGEMIYLWWFRTAVLLLLFMSFSIIFHFLEDIALRYPNLSPFVAQGNLTLSSMCALFFFLLVTSLSWAIYRPVYILFIPLILAVRYIWSKFRRSRVNGRNI